MKLTIIGAGAIGGTVGAFMTEAGHDVTVVDVVREHVDIINHDGLRISGIRGDKRYPLRALHADDLEGPLEKVILAVKGHFTEAVTREQIAPLLADDGYVLSLQNGLNEDIISGLIGRERTIGAFVHFGADYLEPGHNQLGKDEDIHLGELHGPTTDRLLELQDALSAVMPVHLTDNIYGFLWGKLVYGSMAFAVSCVDAPVPDVLDDSRGIAVAAAASAETARVADALGHRMESIGTFKPDNFMPGPQFESNSRDALVELRETMRSAVKQHMGIWRDLKVKKRKTEIDMQCGVVVAQADEAGIDTPVNRAIVRVIHEIERGERSMDWSNLDVLREAIA